MIGKIFSKSSGSFKNRIRYIFGCTKHDHEISDITTVGFNCISGDPLPGILCGDESGVAEMIREFDSVEIMRRQTIDSVRLIKPVFHAMLSLPPGEYLAIAEWRSAIQSYLADLGFDETNQYVAVMHQDRDHQHVHIVANRIRVNEEFSMVKDGNERLVSVSSVSALEDKFGLTKAPKPECSWGVALTNAELKASIRDDDLPFKYKMIAKIAGVIEATNAVGGDMFTFVKLLRRQKIYLHLTLGEDGQPKGVTYEFSGRFISGRKLKRSRLTWAKLITQEGIVYDSETIYGLQKEIARRDIEEQERIRVYYYEFSNKQRRIYIKFTAKQIEIFKLIEQVLKFLDFIFGGGFTPKVSDAKVRYYEYVVGEEQSFLEALAGATLSNDVVHRSSPEPLGL